MSEQILSEEIAALATKLGINNKTLGLLLPSMSASQIGSMVNNHKFNDKFTEEVTVALMVLREIDALGVLPCSPKTLYPNVLLAFVEKVLLAKKYEYTLMELKNDPVWEADLGDAGELIFDHPNEDWDVIGLNNVQTLLRNSIES